MFYQGPLQEGVAMAVTQQKLVVCFVTNYNSESQLWETDFLQDSSIRDLIREGALALRLEAGSESAAHLASLLPLPKIPTIVILKYGFLEQYIAAGMPRNDFIQRMQNAFSNSLQSAPRPPPFTSPASAANFLSSAAPASAEEPSSVSPAPAAEPSSVIPAAAEGFSSTTIAPIDEPYSVTPAPAKESSSAGLSYVSSVSAEGPSSASLATVVSSSSNSQSMTMSSVEAASPGDICVRPLLPERAVTMRTKKEETERKTKEERMEDRGKGKGEAEAGAKTPDPSVYRLQDDAKKRKKEQEDDRERHVKRLEDERKKALHQGTVASPPLIIAPGSEMVSNSDSGELVSISIRFPEGPPMRARFTSTASFRDLRRWVDANRTVDSVPYSLSHLLSPQSLRLIDETEDSKTLTELGFASTSTLILNPVGRYSVAYKNTYGHSRAFFQSALVALLSYLSWLISLAGFGDNGRSSARSSGSVRDNPSRDEHQPNQSLGSQQQLYNGNSVSAPVCA